MNWNCTSTISCSSSISICRQMHLPNIKLPQQQNGLFFKELKPTIPTQSHNTLHLLPKFQPTTHSIHLGKSHFLQKPISNPLKIQCFSTPTNSIWTTTTENLAVLVVGGLFFVASFGCKPSMAALPTSQTSSFSASMEEMKDAHSEKSREDEMYLRMLEKNPRDAETLKVVLSKKMMKGKTKEAVEYVERLIEVEPDEVEWRLLQALSYEMMGNLSKAKMLFKDILEERPLLLRALHGLAMVMHKNLEGPAVYKMLYKALELSQREKRVTEERNIKILIAQMHVVKGELDEGLKKFHDLVEENPRDFRPYLCQGIIYSLLDRKKEAEEQFETYRSLVPNEFPQRGFLDDVVLAAKTEPCEKLEKELDAEFSYKKMKNS